VLAQISVDGGAGRTGHRQFRGMTALLEDPDRAIEGPLGGLEVPQAKQG